MIELSLGPALCYTGGMRLQRILPGLLLPVLLPFHVYAAPSSGLTIGVSVPLTGEAALYGNDIRNGIQFANKELAGGRYRLIIEDDKCSGQSAAAVAQKFAAIDKVDYVLGYGCSGALMAAAPILEKAEIITIGAGTSAPEVAQAGEYIFRTAPNDNDTAAVLGPYIAAHYRHLALMAEETTYAQGVADALVRALSGSPVTVTRFSFLPSDRDFRSLLVRARAMQPDAIFVTTQSDLGLVAWVKQQAAFKFPVPLLSMYYPGSPAFLNGVGELAEGITFADVPSSADLLTEEGLALFRRYRKAYGDPQSFDFYSIAAIAAFHALNTAVSQGGDVRQNLLRTTFDRYFKPFHFKPDGDIAGAITPVMRKVVGGKPAPAT